MNMGWTLLRIDNYAKYKDCPKIVSLEADSNYRTFKSAYDSIKDVGKPTSMMTNIRAMENELNKLIVGNYITEDDAEYKVIKGYINEAIEIQAKAGGSLDSIAKFYTLYNNVIETCSLIRGEKDEPKKG